MAKVTSNLGQATGLDEYMRLQMVTDTGDHILTAKIPFHEFVLLLSGAQITVVAEVDSDTRLPRRCIHGELENHPGCEA